MRRIAGMAFLALTVVTVVGCGGGGTNSGGPGTLKVRLTTANSGSDSAIVLTVRGPAALTSATAGAGLRLFQQPLGGVNTRFALTGLLTNGATILTIGVSDVNAVSQYSASVDGVAQFNYQLRSLPGGYALAVIR